MVKYQVDTATSMLQEIQKQNDAGIIDNDQAEQLSENLLRNLKYVKNGYLGADKSDGTNVVLLGEKTTEGTNRNDVKDSNGVPFIQKIRKQALNGGGYSQWLFPIATGGKPLPKRGYSSYFKPYDWILGTGAYIDDIYVLVAAKAQV
jgi:methyl-accepting chemotaxis protein